MYKILFMILILSGLAWPQGTHTEYQVPVDSSGTLYDITPELKNRTGLFPETENFRSAQIFCIDDNSFVLEVTFLKNGTLSRQRTMLNSSEVNDFRRHITKLLRTGVNISTINQEGRAGLIIRETAMSLVFYGWAIPTAAGIHHTREFAATYMLVGAAGFSLPYYLTKGKHVSSTQRMLTFYGATRGILYGVFIKNIIAPQVHSKEGDFGPPVLGSIASSLLAYHIAEKYQWTLGKAELVGVMGDFGTCIGIGTAVSTGIASSDNRVAAINGTIFGMTGLGLYSGLWLSGRENYTQGDAYVLRDCGILGAQLAIPIADIVGNKHGKAYSNGVMAGAILGIVMGNKMLKRQDFTYSESLLISCGQIAGGLLAGGITYLADSKGNFDELAYQSTTALGSLAGFALLYRSFALGKIKVSMSSPRIDWQLNPLALFQHNTSDNVADSMPPMPFLHIQCKL
jgi:hypothetical protein